MDWDKIFSLIASINLIREQVLRLELELSAEINLPERTLAECMMLADMLGVGFSRFQLIQKIQTMEIKDE